MSPRPPRVLAEPAAGVAAVFVGGGVGTALRLGLDDIIPHSDTQFPWSTILINVVGSFALAFLVSRVWSSAPGWIRAGLGPGLLGGFTTFSAVMVSLVTLTSSGHPLWAFGYLLFTLLLGFGAAVLGMRIGRGDPSQGRSAATTIEVDE